MMSRPAQVVASHIIKLRRLRYPLAAKNPVPVAPPTLPISSKDLLRTRTLLGEVVAGARGNRPRGLRIKAKGELCSLLGISPANGNIGAPVAAGYLAWLRGDRER